MTFITWLTKAIINSDEFKSIACGLFISIFIVVTIGYFINNPMTLILLWFVLASFFVLLFRAYLYYKKYVKEEEEKTT